MQLPLSRLLAGTGIVEASDEALATVVSGVAYRSDRVADGDAFFCIPGFVHDGHDFAADAARRGAGALVVKHPVGIPGVPEVVVEDTRAALAEAAAVVHGRPSESLQVAGITGTNGKTTTAYLLDAIPNAARRVTGLIGTVETRVAGESRKAGRTTPESADLQALLAEMVERGVGAAVMEVSSHAIDLHRVDAIRFGVAGFTNLTQDHLDYHRSMEEYFAVKRRLFNEFDVAERVVNVDDAAGADLARSVGAEWTVSMREPATVRARDVVMDATGSSFTLVTPSGETPVRVPVSGAYNVSNALVAAACAMALGVGLGPVVEGLSRAPQVPGRLERVVAGQPFSVFVDYAHTPDALEKAILAVREITEGRVITVFGCGGDRDPEKRPALGLVAGRLSDRVVVTTDNPRTEDPVGIILHIEDGLREGSATYEVVVDRRQAIGHAMCEAREGDSVLIAGKGHEDYQIFAERTIHFDDREVAVEVLAETC